MTNPWPNYTRLPRAPRGALAALHLGEPRTAELAASDIGEWREALEYCGRSQIALAFERRGEPVMPPEIRETAERDWSHNRMRLSRIEELYRLVAERLGAAGVPFVALKGLTHCMQLGSDPAERAQYDVDLYVPQDRIAAARDALGAAGFEAIEGMEKFPTDHIPALVRKTGWRWRGDVFDPEMPLPVELHFRFWNGELEHLPAPGTEEFWARRESRRIAGVPMGVLCPADALGYAALHLLKHILRGSARPFHVYELACLLDGRADDREFWRSWRATHGAELRRLEGVAFGLAERWFGCRLGPGEEALEELPAPTRAWLREFGLSPAAAPFDSNKDELWLHFSLLESRGEKWVVGKRRLLPGKLTGAVDDSAYAPSGDVSLWRKVVRAGRYSGYILKRVRHHTVALWRVVESGARWRRVRGNNV
jgi:hypothetical protein